MIDRSHPSRWPLAPLLLIALAVALIIGGLALANATSRGDPEATADAPGLADRLDPDQLQLSHVQAAAQRFGEAFATYLSGRSSSAALGRAGGSAELVARVDRTPNRGGPATTAYRAGPVTVAPDGTGWLATATVSDDDERRTAGASNGDRRLSLTFRIEIRHDRPVVVDMNAGSED